MPRWFNILSQSVAMVGQGLNLYGGFIPPKYQGWVSIGLGAAQSTVAIIAHHYNPDGTPATVAYVPPSTKN